MSTRGLVGFVIDGQEKLAYNHSDSYPSWLGTQVLGYLKGANLAEVVEGARALRVVDGETPPTPEDIERLAPFTNLNVSERDTDDWYCLLRETQGDLAAILAAGIIEDYASFALDSLFCEWAYVVDLDRAVLQVYRGFQQAPHDKGRFAGRGQPERGYYAVALVAEWSLERLPEEAEFLATLKEDEEDE